jgi:hypothetical protein
VVCIAGTVVVDIKSTPIQASESITLLTVPSIITTNPTTHSNVLFFPYALRRDFMPHPINLPVLSATLSVVHAAIQMLAIRPWVATLDIKPFVPVARRSEVREIARLHIVIIETTIGWGVRLTYSVLASLIPKNCTLHRKINRTPCVLIVVVPFATGIVTTAHHAALVTLTGRDTIDIPNTPHASIEIRTTITIEGTTSVIRIMWCGR